MELKNIAQIQTGLVLSRKEAKKESDIVEKYLQLNLKAINEKGYIDAEELSLFFAKEKLKAEYLTQIGDIVVRLTYPYTAILIDEKYIGLVIPSHFIVIRANKEKVLSAYLYWLLNTDKVKMKISKNRSSTVIGAVKPADYMAYDLALLSLEEQNIIAELNLQANKELSLLNRLLNYKELYYKEAISKIQKEMRNRQNEDDKE